MKKILSCLMAIVFTVGCLPTAFAAYDNFGKVYSENTDKVYFDVGYAEVGAPVSVKTDESGTDFLYKWYVDKKEISNTGDSYTPIEADIESMLTAEVYTADGELYGSANMLVSKLPVIYIETENREKLVEKKKVLNAHMKLQGNAEFNKESVLYDGEIEIKGRGNSTWQADKKPYKIKLDKKSDLLGMGKNKHWVLLPNPYDSSLSRNKLIYDFAADMGLDTMSSQWVDVVLNGEVVGNYLLCEHVRIGSTRVDITDWDEIAEDTAKAIYNGNKKTMSKAERDELAELMEANMDWVTDGKITFKGKTYTISDYYDLPSTNGGYLLEGFGYEAPYFVSDGGMGVGVSKPEGIGNGMLEEIQGYYSAFEKSAQSADFCTEYNGKKVRYSDLADVESFAKGFLLNEIFQNQDFPARSTYMYKDVDGKLILGPIWDLDMSSDNSSAAYSHNKWTCFTRGYIMNLIKDPAFLKVIYDSYREYRYTSLADMLRSDGDIDTAYGKIYESAVKDDMLWEKNIGFEQNMENFRLWLARRLDWIDGRMSSFETFYASVNGTALNNSGSTTLSLNGTQLTVAMNDSKIANCKVLVNGTETTSLTYSKERKINLGKLEEGSVISVMSYDADGNFLGMSTVTSYNEPVGLKMTKAPSKTTYSAGEKIDLDGIEIKAVYADKSEKNVEPEAAISYVSDCMGAQPQVYDRITDEIGNTYISLRYRGLKLDYKVEKTAGEDSKKVEKLINRLPQNDIENNLEAIFEAKQEYDALSDAAKKAVTNSAKLENMMKKLDAVSEKSKTPILGCYIDGIGRIGQRNTVVVIAKGKPNKIRFFSGGGTTTIPVANREYCVSEKSIAGYSVMAIPYRLTAETVNVGAYYNHILNGEMYTFSPEKLVENRNGMIKSMRYEKQLTSVNETAKIELSVSDRVEMVTADCGGVEYIAIPENGKATLEMNFSSSGSKDVELTYYSDGEAHNYKSVQLYVREKTTSRQLALKFPAETAYDEADVFAATSPDVGSVKLVADGRAISLKASMKNGYKIWKCTVETGTGTSYKVYVDSKDTGKTVEIKKLEKLLIENGTLVECRIKSGTVDIPYSVKAVADNAFDGFNGTIRCYKNSAAHIYAQKNDINYVNYGYTIDTPNEKKMNIGDTFTVTPVAAPLIAPDFSMSLGSDNEPVLAPSSDGFKALKPGYARATVKTNDGTLREIRVYVGGGCTVGDVNGDGKINSTDSLIILRAAVGMTELGSEEKSAADINRDSKINSIDALIVLQISVEARSIWDFV